MIKGGVAVELLMRQKARAIKDLGAAVRARAEEIEPLLRDALARGWDGFSFRLVSWEPIHDTNAWRGDIKLAFKGQPFFTVKFETAPAEGDAGRETQLVENTFVNVAALGLRDLPPTRQTPVAANGQRAPTVASHLRQRTGQDTRLHAGRGRAGRRRRRPAHRRNRRRRMTTHATWSATIGLSDGDGDGARTR